MLILLGLPILDHFISLTDLFRCLIQWQKISENKEKFLERQYISGKYLSSDRFCEDTYPYNDGVYNTGQGYTLTLLIQLVYSPN